MLRRNEVVAAVAGILMEEFPHKYDPDWGYKTARKIVDTVFSLVMGGGAKDESTVAK